MRSVKGGSIQDSHFFQDCLLKLTNDNSDVLMVTTVGISGHNREMIHRHPFFHTDHVPRNPEYQ